MNTSNHQKGEEYQSIFDNALEGIFQTSLDGRFLQVNPAMARIYGYASPDDMVKSITDIAKQIHVDLSTRQQFLGELTKHERVEGFEARNYRKDGSIIWTRINARAVRDDEGNILFFEGFLTDITANKEAELALRESEERYRALVDHLPGVVFLDAHDDSEKTFYVSPKIEEVLGYSQREWTEEIFWSDVIHPEDRERVLAENKHTDKTGELFIQEYRIQKKDGEYIWIREEASLIKDEHGEPIFWQGFFLDISKRKVAESAIQQSEEQFKTIFQANPIASCIATLDEGRYIAANDAYWKLTDFKPNEFLGHTSRELGFIDEQKRSQFIKRLKKEKSIHNKHGKLITKSGEIRTTLEFWESIVFDGQDCTLGMFYDITDQTKAQDELRENEEKYRQLFESESDALFLIDNEKGDILEVNNAATTLYGYSKEELLQKKNSDLSAEPNDTRKVTQNTPANKERVISIPIRYHRKKDGTIFPVEITGRFFEWRGHPVHIAAIRDITERIKTEESVQRQLEELSILHNVALAASSSKNVDELIQRVTDTISDTLHPDNCGIELIIEKDMLVPHPSYRGAFGDNFRWRLHISEGVTGKVASTGIPIRLGDVSQEPSYIEATVGVQSELCVPIKMQDRIIGVINIESKKPDAFSETDERLLNTIAGTMATAIEQLRLFETSQRRLQELTILNAVSQASTEANNIDELIEKITQIIGESLYPDNFGMLLINEDGTALHPHASYRGISDGKYPTSIPLEHGVSGKVAATGKPLRIANTRKHKSYIEVTPQVRSELCVPISVQGSRIFGVINAESLKINAFSEDDEQLLTTIASTLATAIEKLHLLEAEKKRRQDAEILREATTALTTSLDIQTLLETILDNLANIVPYYSASIAMKENDKLFIVAGRGFPDNYDVIGKQLKSDGLWTTLGKKRGSVIISDVQSDPE